MVLYLTCSLAIAQSELPSLEHSQAPDNKQIEAAVTNISSPYYYPRLFERYVDGDTTLNLQDYRHLYYGYIFEESYKPLETISYADSIAVTLEKNKDDTILSPEIFDKIELYGKKMLKTTPFNLNYINMLTYIYQMQGDMDRAEASSYRFKMVKEAIFSSGTGLSKDSPWCVLYREDEFNILSIIKARYSKRIYVTFSIEFFHTPIKTDGNKGYYFDVSRMYLKRPEDSGAKEQQKRKFEFNPYQNPKSKSFIKNNIEY